MLRALALILTSPLSLALALLVLVPLLLFREEPPPASVVTDPPPCVPTKQVELLREGDHRRAEFSCPSGVEPVVRFDQAAILDVVVVVTCECPDDLAVRAEIDELRYEVRRLEDDKIACDALEEALIDELDVCRGERS